MMVIAVVMNYCDHGDYTDLLGLSSPQMTVVTEKSHDHFLFTVYNHTLISFDAMQSQQLIRRS
jgi:hypothetical protein